MKSHVKRGAKLLQGMRCSNAEAGALYGAASVKSIFDGDCKDSLNIWKYMDDTPEMQELSIENHASARNRKREDAGTPRT